MPPHRYYDFVSKGRELVALLKTKNVDLIVCLAHARIPNTEKMAMEIPGVDIVLGGHEHAVFEKKFGNDSWAVVNFFLLILNFYFSKHFSL